MARLGPGPALVADILQNPLILHYWSSFWRAAILAQADALLSMRFEVSCGGGACAAWHGYQHEVAVLCEGHGDRGSALQCLLPSAYIPGPAS